MASTIVPIIPVQTPSHASTLMTVTRAAAAISVATPTTSNFVLSPTAGGRTQRPITDSSTTIAFAIIIPLVALITLLSVIVFRLYRSRKEREEAAAAEAARAKTRAIEQQISDLASISEKFDLDKYRISPGTREFPGNAKDIPMDIPIELEADEPEKKRYHGL